MKNKILRDILLIAILLTVSAVLLISQTLSSKSGSAVEIRHNGILYKTVSLKNDAEIDVEGVLTVVISNGTAYVKAPTCKNKICQNHSPISKTGETIACLPNGITIKVIGDGDVDFAI